MGPISESLNTLSLKIEQNTNSLKDNSSIVKSYDEVVSSSSPSSCEQLRQSLGMRRSSIVKLDLSMRISDGEKLT